jgi:hypothetical protein
MSCPVHLSCLDNSNYTWRRVQVMKLLIPRNETEEEARAQEGVVEPL